MTRPYDIVLFGATGYTGGLIAEYLADASSRESFRWALAGRNAGKLQALRDRLPAGLPKPSLLHADISQPDSLEAMAQAGRVLITTVGPYAQYGEPVVKACAMAGTHYLDLTGEPHFAVRMQQRWHEVAQYHGARIVHSCGFESIPPDLGVLYTLGCLRQRLGERGWEGTPVRVSCGVEAGGGVSGGTWHSALQALADPRAVIKDLPLPQFQIPLRYESRWRRWGLSLPLIDASVVRRSASLQGARYGAPFTYRHYVLSRRLWQLAAGTLAVGGLMTLLRFPRTRDWLLEQKPAGEGPSAQARAKGWFRFHFLAEGGGTSVQTIVMGGDPFYGETAKMIAESALCLALDKGLPECTGVITPAAAMGEPLIRRLQRAGIQFMVERRSRARSDRGHS